MMQRHIARLENYVSTMNTLQRLEDIEIQKSPVSIELLLYQLQETGASICADKTFLLKQLIIDPCENTTFLSKETISPKKINLDTSETIHSKKMNLDASIIMQVYENLLSNAMRYAQNTITVSPCIKDNYFYLIVSDDGVGFSAKDLSEATKPFYKAAEKATQEHFGMGLNICKILCEKHGGFLKLENKDGAVVTAGFLVG